MWEDGFGSDATSHNIGTKESLSFCSTVASIPDVSIELKNSTFQFHQNFILFVLIAVVIAPVFVSNTAEPTPHSNGGDGAAAATGAGVDTAPATAGFERCGGEERGSSSAVLLTTPETQPTLPLSHVLPFKWIGAAFSQQKVPNNRCGKRKQDESSGTIVLGCGVAEEVE